MNCWKLFRNSVGAALLIITATAVCAQAVADKPPYYKTLEPNMEWVIKVTLVNKVEGRRTFREIRGSRSNSLRHEVISWVGGETERWLTGRFLLETLPDQRDVIPTPYPPTLKEMEKRLAEFPELNWLAPEHQKGVAEVNGKSCRYYTKTVVVKPEIDAVVLEMVARKEIEMPRDSVYNYQAWIDATTGLPVAYESSDYRYEYEFTFSETPISLTLPNRFLQAARMIDPKFTP